MIIKNIKDSPFSKIISYIGERIIYLHSSVRPGDGALFDPLVYQFLTLHMKSKRHYFVITHKKNSFIGMNNLINWFEKNLNGYVYITCNISSEGWGPMVFYICFEKKEDEVLFKLQYPTLLSHYIEELIS